MPCFLRKKIVLLYLCFFSKFAEAIDQTAGAWFPTQYLFRINDRFTFSEEIWPRYTGETQLTQFFTRSSIRYRFNESWQGAFGYAWIRNLDSNNDIISIEKRPFLQLAYRTDLQKTSVSARTRLEYRNIQQGEPSFRFRQGLGLSYPLSERWSFDNEIEAFFNLHRIPQTSTTSGLEQTRISSGFSYEVSKNLSVNVGYLNRTLIRRIGSSRMDHLMSLGFIVQT